MKTLIRLPAMARVWRARISCFCGMLATLAATLAHAEQSPMIGANVRVAATLPAQIVSAPTVVGEGDVATFVLRRTGSLDSALYVHTGPIFGPGGVGAEGALALGDAQGSADIAVQLLQLETPDISVDRNIPITFYVADSVSRADVQLPAVSLRVLDNDSVDLDVLRAGPNRLALASALARIDPARATSIVLDYAGGFVQTARDDGVAPLGTIDGNLTLYGNQARISMPQASESAPYLFDVGASGDLRIRDFLIAGYDRGPYTGILRNAGQARFERTRLVSIFSPVIPVENFGGLTFSATSFTQIKRGPPNVGAGSIINRGGSLHILSSNLYYLGDSIHATDGQIELHAVSALRTQSPESIVFRQDGGEASWQFGHVFIGDNFPNQLVGVPRPNPPPRPCSAVEATSIGFNIEDADLCGLHAPTDRAPYPFLVGGAPTSWALGGVQPFDIAIDGGATAAEAGTSGCGPTDQNGMPRPQTLVEGATPRCEIGALELGVNPYRGIWSPARSGHGVDIQTSGNRLLLAWYTYDDFGEPTAYQAAAPLTGPHWNATLQQASRNPQTGAVTVRDVGRVGLDFASDTAATLRWRFDSRGIEGAESLQASVFEPGTPRFEVTGLWYPPQDSGYAATISRRGERTALGLYYYDAAGKIRWVLGTGNGADAIELGMTSFEGFCPDCDATQMPLTARPAGNVLVHFRTPERARLDVDVTYPGPAGGRWQRAMVQLQPLSDPVDNRNATGTMLTP